MANIEERVEALVSTPITDLGYRLYDVLYVKEGKERQEALNMAIGYCIEHDILSEFLKSYRAEVLGMLLEEFDVDKYERTIKAEGREEGREEILELTRKLMEQNRMDDLKRLAEDSAYREKLFREFGL